MSKILEKFLCKQLKVFSHQNLSKYQCGFRKGFSGQYSLVAMLDKWKDAVDDKKVIGTPLADLFKAFNCLCHELIIAKLNAYDFSLPALKLIYDYLCNRQQRIKINHDFSSWLEVLFGVPQGSVLGPIFFNICLSDLFLVMKETGFSRYADDNTLSDAGNIIEDVFHPYRNHPENFSNGFPIIKCKAILENVI